MMLPDSNFLSVPLWIIDTLSIVTLSLHLISMNFMFGGIIILLFGKFEDKWNNPIVEKFIKLFPNAMAMTVSFGVAPLLFVQLVYPQQIYSSAIVSGWYWLLVVAVVIIAYYALYASAFSKKTDSRQKIYLSIAFVCLLYVSYIYTSVFALAEKPDLYKLLYAQNQGGTIINPDLNSYLFRWLHMLTGAVTVGGFFVALFGRKNEPAFAVGKQFYLWGMVASIATGLVYMMGLGELMKPFMKSPAIWLVLVSLVLSLGSLYFLFKKKFTVSSIMLAVSFVSMVTIRHIVRKLALIDFHDPSTMAVNPQWSPFVIFLIFFVLAIATIWYMLKLFFGKQK